jgi:hypothetical protein
MNAMSSATIENFGSACTSKFLERIGRRKRPATTPKRRRGQVNFKLGNGRASIIRVFPKITGCGWISRNLQVAVVPISHTGVAIVRHPNREQR